MPIHCFNWRCACQTRRRAIVLRAIHYAAIPAGMALFLILLATVLSVAAVFSEKP